MVNFLIIISYFSNLKLTRSTSPERAKMGKKVGIIGGGNFGTAMGNILSKSLLQRSAQGDGQQFDENIKIWIYDEKTENGKSLCDEINKRHENFKYLPNIQLPANLKFIKTDEEYISLLKESDILVYVLPTTVAKKFALDLVKYDIRDKEIVTLMKGFVDIEEKKPILFSEFVDSLNLGHKVAALMGANIANDMHKDVCEMTLGIKNQRLESEDLFQTENTNIQVINDNIGVELCGALKNIVAIAFGITQGLDLSVNTQMCILRRGITEMNEFIAIYKEKQLKGTKTQEVTEKTGHVMFQSCGIPDLMVTSFFGRNSNGGTRIGKGETVKQIEKTMNGQKLHGVSTAETVYDYLMSEKKEIQEKFKLFKLVYEIAKGEKEPKDITIVLK